MEFLKKHREAVVGAVVTTLFLGIVWFVVSGYSVLQRRVERHYEDRVVEKLYGNLEALEPQGKYLRITGEGESRTIRVMFDDWFTTSTKDGKR